MIVRSKFSPFKRHYFGIVEINRKKKKKGKYVFLCMRCVRAKEEKILYDEVTV